MDSSSLVLAVFDGSQELNDDDRIIIKSCQGKRCVAVINKSDLKQRINIEEIENNFENIVYISAKNGEGAENIEQAVKAVLGTGQVDTAQPILANKRQKLCVQRALENVNEALDAVKMGITFDAVNVMIDSAVDELLTLTGKKATEEVVNNIFSKFCVGK